MALYFAKIVFTGEQAVTLNRPNPMTVVVRASTLNLAAKRIAKFASRKWRYYSFTVNLVDCGRVLK